jgi:hypothetical protein
MYVFSDGSLLTSHSNQLLSQNSTVRNSSFSEASPSARNSAATGAQPVPARPNSSAALQVLVNAHGKGRPQPE